MIDIDTELDAPPPPPPPPSGVVKRASTRETLLASADRTAMFATFAKASGNHGFAAALLEMAAEDIATAQKLGVW